MRTNTLERVRAAHCAVAKLVIHDPIYLPIFERLESELAMAEAQQMSDPIAAARARMAAQRAICLGSGPID
jgi:hypothetical protein